MKKHYLIFFAFILLLLTIALPVYAYVIETGVLSGSGYNSSYYDLTTGIPTDKGLTGFYVNDIQYTAGLKTLIRFDAGHRPTFNDTVSGRSMPFVGTWGSYIVCTGTIGYQRLWDNAYPTPNEIDGYQYIVFDTWDYANYTGDIYIHLDYNKTLFGIHHYPYVPSPNLPSGKIALGFRQDSPLVETSFAGNYLLNRDFTFYNEYIATKPQGLGITGTVGKTYYGEIYNSQAFVINGTSPYETLASQSTATSSDLEFNVPATTIKVCVLDTLQQWHNSSKLFSTGQEPNFTPTPTGTSTPTPTPTYAPTDTWTMEVYPTAINLHEEAQLYISCSNSSKMSDAKVILYYEDNNLGSYSHFELIGVYRYNSSTSNWDFRPNNLVAYDYTPHDPALLMVTPATTGIYSYQVAIFGANSVPFGTANGELLIGAQGGQSSALTMNLYAYDGSTIGHLSNYELTLTDEYGYSHTYTVSYDIDVSLQRGSIYSLSGHKEGYEDRTISFTVPVNQNIQRGDFGAIASVGLYPTGVLTPSRTTLTVFVRDKDNYMPIPLADVTVNGTRKTTNEEGGGVWFVLNYNTTYTIQYSKVGYCSGSDSVTTTTTNTMFKDVYIKLGTCLPPTPKPTLTYTPIPTIQPTPTTTGGVYVNGTWCPNPTNLKEAIDFAFCSQGFGKAGSDSLNLIYAVLICLAFALLFAYILKDSAGAALGVIAGVFFGFVISLAIGLIPLWIFFVIFVLGCIIFGLWLYARGAG